MNKDTATPWHGPGGRAPRRPFSWNALLWGIIYPQRSHRIVPTIPGTVLIALSLGIGMAAYNASSNILFLTLSLLLACLVLSGVLSWLNLRGVGWRLQLPTALRAGHDALVGLELRNAKRILPTHGLWFNLRAHAQAPAAEQRAETTFTGRGIDIRAVLAHAEAAEVKGRVVLSGRLDPQRETHLGWVFQPAKRGRLRLELASVGSLFPFGFLRKYVGVALASDVVVWPAPIEYRRHLPAVSRRQSGDEQAVRAGVGNDLIAVRRYNAGDSHRLIHWKASARTRQLLVRQFAAEAAEAYALWLRTEAGVWPRPEQFEVLVRFTATLAEDLFRTGRLKSVAIDDQGSRPIRGIRDLEQFLDSLAVLEPKAQPPVAVRAPASHHVLTFLPEGARGVAAMVDGQRVASA